MLVPLALCLRVRRWDSSGLGRWHSYFTCTPMAWLDSEMFKFNLIYKFFPASAMSHILYKDLSVVLSVQL